MHDFQRVRGPRTSKYSSFVAPLKEPADGSRRSNALRLMGSWCVFFCEARVPMRLGPFLAIAILLFLLWIGGFVVFHVAGSLIHLLLLIAIVSLVVHFFTGSRTA